MGVSSELLKALRDAYDTAISIGATVQALEKRFDRLETKLGQLADRDSLTRLDDRLSNALDNFKTDSRIDVQEATQRIAALETELQTLRRRVDDAEGNTPPQDYAADA